MRTVQQTITGLVTPPGFQPLPAPAYEPSSVYTTRVGLAVESMRHHMTDEGWQIFQGLQHAGYTLAGHNLPPNNLTDVRDIIQRLTPSTVVMQDKREWDVSPRDFRDKRARFTSLEALKDNPSIFKLTILKDSHQRPNYHKESAQEINCHAWVIYYHPRIVQHLAPYVRPQHLVRTYHSVDASLLPPYTPKGRDRCLLSGAVSGAYPLRTMLVKKRSQLPAVDFLPHPGYHRDGTHTPRFLGTLCSYKLAICTSSVFGYALRKIIEATVCGCHVLTDLPVDEVLPEIDGNLTRIIPTSSVHEVAGHVAHLLHHYSPEKQEYFANAARRLYDYRVVGQRLAQDIERLRHNYRD